MHHELTDLRAHYDTLAASVRDTKPGSAERAEVMEAKKRAFLAWKAASDGQVIQTEPPAPVVIDEWTSAVVESPAINEAEDFFPPSAPEDTIEGA